MRISDWSSDVCSSDLHPAVAVQPIVAHQNMARMIGREVETGADDPLRGPLPHQRGIGALAQHQPKTIEQDRFARPGFPGQHGKPAPELQVARLDQHDVTDGTRDQYSEYHPPSSRRSRHRIGLYRTRRRSCEANTEES